MIKINSEQVQDVILSIILPVFNESATVAEAINAVLATPYRKEIIVVDDGSTDGTRDILAGICHPDVSIIFHEKNTGKGRAIRSGFAQATGDIILIQDADLEYDPSEYHVLLQPILAGKADVVYGSRFAGHGTHRVLYFWHYVGNRFLTLLSNLFTNLNLTDMESCYKAFTKEALQGVQIKENRFGFEPEITAKMAKKGLRIYEVPVSYYGRTYEEGKKIGWRDGLWAIWCILRYNIFPR
ncbi:MAG: glycosyltransferase family 2 protein [Deltaproteobacteria bacterium]|nr:glycosyltransferase family 2 protein [Deltaproteobacteria bacterium]